MTCDLCGFQFDEKSCQTGCSSCHSSCQGVRCPRCFYEVLPKWKMPLILERLFRPFRGPRASEILSPQAAAPEHPSLLSFQVNTRATVVSINAPDRFRLKKILAMGITPGVEITLLRKFPSFVFEIGHSRFSVDRELAGSIRVSR